MFDLTNLLWVKQTQINEATKKEEEHRKSKAEGELNSHSMGTSSAEKSSQAALIKRCDISCLLRATTKKNILKLMAD